MNKPVDGAEARLRDAATSVHCAVGVATGDLRAMLAHSAALVAENERLREALKPFANPEFTLMTESGVCVGETSENGLVLTIDADYARARTALETRHG